MKKAFCKFCMVFLALTIMFSCKKEEKPKVLFDYDKILGSYKDYNEMSVSFDNHCEGATTYLWDFGDGSTSTDFAPSHTYSSNGNYTVTLTATNSGGSSTLTKQITIKYGQVVFYITQSANGSVSVYPSTASANWLSWCGYVTTVCSTSIPTAWYPGCFTYTWEAGTYIYHAETCSGAAFTGQYQVIAGQCKAIKIF